jgi:hypothetical protein
MSGLQNSNFCHFKAANQPRNVNLTISPAPLHALHLLMLAYGHVGMGIRTRTNIRRLACMQHFRALGLVNVRIAYVQYVDDGTVVPTHAT